ncbi:VOC family protein [Parafrankia sp. FMc2]|uniref:VOC family protein n=1 Tax=Parafrankia sp. FMc2 TaxID=3233196 RepID=UPI0034D683DB
MPLGAISWNLVWTHDIGPMTAWYRDGLGLKVLSTTEQSAVFDTGPCILVLIGRHDNGPSANPPLRGWERNQVLFTFKVDDMDAELAELAERGVEPIHIAPVVIDGVDTPRWRVAQLMDPEGNIVELCDEPVRWHPHIHA